MHGAHNTDRESDSSGLPVGLHAGPYSVRTSRGRPGDVAWLAFFPLTAKPCPVATGSTCQLILPSRGKGAQQQSAYFEMLMALQPAAELSAYDGISRIASPTALYAGGLKSVVVCPQGFSVPSQPPLPSSPTASLPD